MRRPVLLDYATPRTDEDNKIFTYDYDKDMNVLNDNRCVLFIEGGSVAIEGGDIININSDYRELCTKTEICREEDDDNPFLFEF